MKLILAIVVVIGSILGGYLPHGSFGVLVQPLEVLIICGATIGGYIMANPKDVVIQGFKTPLVLMKPSPWNKELYFELCGLMFKILNKSRKDGLMSLEGDVEDPHASALFSEFPKIQNNHHVLDFICDYLRMMIGGSMNAYEIENLMDAEMEAHHKEAHRVPNAVFEAGQSLPGFGIVAAVLGIIVTMGYLDASALEIGAKVAAALVGTMLGLLLLYGFVGPSAIALNHLMEEEAQFYVVIKSIMIASLNGYAPVNAIEFGRKSIPPAIRPSFLEMDEHLQTMK